MVSALKAYTWFRSPSPTPLSHQNRLTEWVLPLHKKHVLIYTAHALPCWRQSTEPSWPTCLLLPAFVQICHEVLASILQLLWLNLNLANFPLEIWVENTTTAIYPFKCRVPRKWKTKVPCKSQRKELRIMQQQKQKRGIQPEGCRSQRMWKVRLAPAGTFRRASFVYACLCGVVAAAQPPLMAAPGSRRICAKRLVWVVPRGSDRCERTEAQRVLGKLKRDETQVAISKTQHGVPDTATELAMAGQCLGWTAFSPMLSFLHQLLLSHLNGGAGGYRHSMPAPCPLSLPTSNIFSWLMVQPSFIFPLLFCSCCLYSWPYISCGQKSHSCTPGSWPLCQRDWCMNTLG